MTNLTISYNNEQYTIANPYCVDYGNCVLISIGAYASDRVLVFTEQSCDMCDIMTVLEDALDTIPSEEWDISKEYNALYVLNKNMGMSDEDAYDDAYCEATPINGGSHYVSDWYCDTPMADLVEQAMLASQAHNEVEA
jgi:hypothetical protein